MFIVIPSISHSVYRQHNGDTAPVYPGLCGEYTANHHISLSQISDQTAYSGVIWAAVITVSDIPRLPIVNAAVQEQLAHLESTAISHGHRNSSSALKLANASI